jgi:hypothetical protein
LLDAGAGAAAGLSKSSSFFLGIIFSPQDV